jgi:phytoene/squalene synthetase
MSTRIAAIDLSSPGLNESRADAAAMTRAASAQTYYTIRLLADRDRAADAYRAYAYFRWVDDRVDDGATAPAERATFLNRQRALLEAGYRGRMPADLSPEEGLLAELIAGDDEPDSGLQAYLRNMMAVMEFDRARRGRVTTEAELAAYSRALAVAVMEALLHFIGHGSPAPTGETRYRAVFGAHVIHMLRDVVEDAAAGYFNVPDESWSKPSCLPEDSKHDGLPHGLLHDPAYRAWARERVALARDCFRDGRDYIARLENPRRRLAGYAYVARFEWMARLIERDGYRPRAAYPERKSLAAGLWVVWRTVTSLFISKRNAEAAEETRRAQREEQ